MRKTMKYKAVLTCFTILFPIMLSFPVQALEPIAIYDDFNLPFINPEKWIGMDSYNQESIREIVSKSLHMSIRTSSINGYGFKGFNHLSLLNSSAITAMEASLKVNKLHVQGCLSDPNNVTRASAMLFGTFFNTAQPTPGSYENDVFAHVVIQRNSISTDPPGSLKVFGLYYQCTNPSCTTLNIIDAKILGTVQVKTNINVILQWDQKNHQFIFQLNHQPPVTSTYTLPDTSLPGVPVKALNVQGENDNSLCTTATTATTAGRPQPMAFIDASFDNVYINQSATQ